MQPNDIVNNNRVHFQTSQPAAPFENMGNLRHACEHGNNECLNPRDHLIVSTTIY